MAGCGRLGRRCGWLGWLGWLGLAGVGCGQVGKPCGLGTLQRVFLTAAELNDFS